MIVKDNFLLYRWRKRSRNDSPGSNQTPWKHNPNSFRWENSKDNPKYKNKKNWLPEIYQIGVRNPQGMDLSPFDDNNLTNHGAKGGDWFGEVRYGENYEENFRLGELITVE